MSVRRYSRRATFRAAGDDWCAWAIDSKIKLLRHHCKGARWKHTSCLPRCMYHHALTARFPACIKKPSFKRKKKFPKAGALSCIKLSVYPIHSTLKAKYTFIWPFFPRFDISNVTALKDQLFCMYAFWWDTTSATQIRMSPGRKGRLVTWVFPTCFQRCARLTAGHTECVWAELAAARTAGQEPAATSECATLSASNTEPARTASASVTRAGTENTAPSVSISVYLCVCVHVWVGVMCVCSSATWVCRGTQWDFCDSYFALHSGNWDTWKADHRGFAK